MAELTEADVRVANWFVIDLGNGPFGTMQFLNHRWLKLYP